MFFAGWENLLRVLTVGVLTYVGLVVFLRISGKRTLSSMNAFDFIVTVAFGSTLATTILPSKPTLVDGLAALALLIVLQFAVAWLEIRSSWFHGLVTSHPTIVFYRGSFVEKNMRKERVEHGEIMAVIRRDGIIDLEKVEAVVLETDGSFSVLPRPDKAVISSSIGDIETPET